MEYLGVSLLMVIYTVKPIYKGHSREPENVPFMKSFPLYTGENCMHYL